MRVFVCLCVCGEGKRCGPPWVVVQPVGGPGESCLNATTSLKTNDTKRKQGAMVGRGSVEAGAQLQPRDSHFDTLSVS